jgi:hypothetical protein
MNHFERNLVDGSLTVIPPSLSVVADPYSMALSPDNRGLFVLSYVGGVDTLSLSLADTLSLSRTLSFSLSRTLTRSVSLTSTKSASATRSLTHSATSSRSTSFISTKTPSASITLSRSSTITPTVTLSFYYFDADKNTPYHTLQVLLPLLLLQVLPSP